MLGLDGSLSPRLQARIGRLAADVSFAKTAEHVASLLDVGLASGTIRTFCERKAGAVARWQARETDSAALFKAAEGQWEFAVDAGKVNTL